MGHYAGEMDGSPGPNHRLRDDFLEKDNNRLKVDNIRLRAQITVAEAALERAGYIRCIGEAGWKPTLGQSAAPFLDEIDRLRSVFEAAYGLCMGYDWNGGTAAKLCGYKRKLLSAVNAIEPVPDFEGKYKSAR